MTVAVGSRVYSVQGLRWELAGLPEHPDWLANVCCGLAGLGISVVTGHATHDAGGWWRAHLDVDVTRALVDPESVDVAALEAERQPARSTEPLRLTALDVARREDGLLVVQLAAPDELGFLGRLLRELATLKLHPFEVAVSTRTGVAHDRLVLSAAGGQAPSAEVQALLSHVLSGFLAPARR
jgi:hypothetical protein